MNIQEMTDKQIENRFDYFSNTPPKDREEMESRLKYYGIIHPSLNRYREDQIQQNHFVKGIFKYKDGTKVFATQQVHTPMKLVDEILDKIEESYGSKIRDWKNLKICVLNIEFLEGIYRRKIDNSNTITFISDNKVKINFAQKVYDKNVVNIETIYDEAENIVISSSDFEKFEEVEYNEDSEKEEVFKCIKDKNGNIFDISDCEILKHGRKVLLNDGSIIEMSMNNKVGNKWINQLNDIETSEGKVIKKGEYNVIAKGSAIVKTSYFTDRKDMAKKKFDIVIMNPPYQILKEGNSKSQAVWPKFVEKAFEVCKEDGIVAAIHPSGWRNADGMFKDTQELLKNKQIDYLEMHDEKDGLKTFGAETRYDWYVAKNCPNENHETTILCQDESIEKCDISKMEFIPNGMFEEVKKLMAKDGEEKVEIIHSYSSYETRKPHMSKEKTEAFCHPCVYTVNSESECSFFYSTSKSFGMFGIPKLIWSNGRITSVGSYIDEKGEYGLTQFSYAIIDSIENLKNIKKAFDSDEFRKIMSVSAVGDLSINRKVIAQFRKDFWKSFI